MKKILLNLCLFCALIAISGCKISVYTPSNNAMNNDDNSNNNSSNENNQNDNSSNDDSNNDNSNNNVNTNESGIPNAPLPLIDHCAIDTNACIDRVYNPSALYDSYEEAYEQTYKSVVSVVTFVAGDVVMSSGSGVIYSVSSDEKYTYIITNGHVIKDTVTVGGTMFAKYFEVVYHNNVRVKATLIAKDLSEDIAILKAEIEPNCDFKVAKLGDDTTLKIGEKVFAIGSPFSVNHHNTLTVGVVSGLNVVVDSDNDADGTSTRFYLTQIDAALSSGNSGGPLFNMRGEVVGINTLKLDGNNSNIILESMNFSLKINNVINIANEILKKGVYSRPFIGISAISISELSLTERQELGISTSILNGIFVDGVYAETPAANVIMKHSIITKINNKFITSFGEFNAELLNYKKGDTISLTVVDLNNENEQVKQIILG